MRDGLEGTEILMADIYGLVAEKLEVCEAKARQAGCIVIAANEYGVACHTSDFSAVRIRVVWF